VAILILNDISFTDGSNIVDGSLQIPPEGLFVGGSNDGQPDTDDGNPVNTGGGNDRLYGEMNDFSTQYPIPPFKGSFRIGALLFNILSLGKGNDRLIGSASTSVGAVGVYGIDLELSGGIEAGSGNDEIEGVAHSSSELSDFVAGIIINENTSGATIDTGAGNDRVTGLASGSSALAMNGIWLLGPSAAINTGDGNDIIIGISNAVGDPSNHPGGIVLVETARIETGAGNDKVIARATLNGSTVNGFVGTGLIDLGAGNDTMEGFGGITAKGGSGQDVWDLSAYNKSDFVITKTGPDAASFTYSGVTAYIEGFEKFVFADGSFRFADIA